MIVVGKMFRGIVFFIIVLMAANAWAVSSSLWEVDEKSDFDSGEPDGISILAPGQVVLGPRATATPLDALYAWVLVEDSKGNIYAGTGNDGKIFRISPKGEVDLFAELDLQQVFALAVDAEDVFYAGGFPSGKIYSINRDAEVAEYFDTEQDSVWALCIDADDTLFAATGDEGRIYRIQKGGKSDMLYDSPERRILSLLCDARGNLYAGSEQNGIIYRIDKSGHPGVLYDTELEEITSMVMGSDRNLYAVSSPGDLFVKFPPQVAPGISKAGGASAAPAKARPAMPTMPAIPSPKKRTCIIYKITEDGAASQFWTSPEKLIFSIVFDGNNILAGSGDDGIIYMIPPSGEASTYYKSDQKQVVFLHRSSGGSIIASLGNDAGLVMFDEGYVENGVFLSQVHDTTTISRWGRVFWEADLLPRTQISLAIRSGNSETPDDTWSEWTKEQNDSKGFVPESPKARYVQWRGTLNSSHLQKTPTLKKVTVAYLQSNLAPEVQSIDVVPDSAKKNDGKPGASVGKMLKGLASGKNPGGGEKGAGKANTDGVKAPVDVHDSTLEISWQASDQNGDTLEYALYFKGVGETRWKLLEDELTGNTYKWDTEAVPDGEYHVKVGAGDFPSNPVESSLSDELVSEAFTIDNTSPVADRMRAVRARNSEDYRITATVSDNLSPIRSAQYSIDAGEWLAIFPDDGIFDSLTENIEFTIGQVEKGEHTVVLKLVDYFGNVGAGKITFEAK